MNDNKTKSLENPRRIVICAEVKFLDTMKTVSVIGDSKNSSIDRNYGIETDRISSGA